MVNIVLVSHSALLAAGVVEMMRMVMQQSQVSIAVAAGTGDPSHPLGTDAAKIRDAIEEVYSDDGVLVLMDLGSAVLSAEMALDFLAGEKRHRVRLCAAPLVEGAIAAAIQASLGASLERVAAEAEGALSGKIESLGRRAGAAAVVLQPSSVSPAATGVQQVRLVVENRLGLHARPAALFVQTAGRFQSDIRVARAHDSRQVNAKSFNAVAALGIRQNDEIVISATGVDAADALTALQQLAAQRFGEIDDVPDDQQSLPSLRSTDTPPGALRGIAASPGYALGQAVVLRTVEPQIERLAIDDPAAEMARFSAALEAVRRKTRQVRDQIAQRHPYEAAIFDAYQMFLSDPDVLSRVQQIVEHERVNVEWAWQQVVRESVQAFEALDNDYMRARAVDIRDVGLQVLTQLLGHAAVTHVDQAGIIVVDDLSPSDTARLDPTKVLGICTERGSPTAHSAILARTLGIPAVVGVGPIVAQVRPATPIIVDGSAGLVWIDPDESIIADYQTKLVQWRATYERAQRSSAAPAVTKDGIDIEVAANIGNLEDARAALANGADGVGLLRTEFLFLDRTTAPDEEEQFEAYHAIARLMGQRPIVIRTLDVGGDKLLPYLRLAREENPFLGQRAIRLCLERPDLFKPQLRAILRAAAGHRIRMMVPMIADIGEWRRVRRILDETIAELRRQGVPIPDHVDVGMMVEVPSAALLAHIFAPEVDFFSIGSNDLTQYTLAAERGNASVAYLQDGLHPAVLIQIRQVVQSAEAASKWVSVCGELAADRQALPILIGLGVKKLSMSPGAIPQAKELVRQITRSDAQQWANHALTLESADAVRQFIQQKLAAIGENEG